MEIDALELRLHAAEALARKAGSLLLQHEASFLVEEKAKNDFVTDADKASEALISSTLEALFPSDGFHGEESGDRSKAFPRWVVDPIDGTADFIRGIPDYTVSIAFEESYGNPVLGVVYNPRQDELYSGLAGKGAFLNGRSIRVSDVTNPSEAVMIAETPFRKKEWAKRYFTLFEDIYQEISDIRCLGSIALELCYIASGRADAVFEYNLGYWDVAAGCAILKAAGGEYSTIDPGKVIADEPVDFIATNGSLQAWLEGKVRPFGDIRPR